MNRNAGPASGGNPSPPPRPHNQLQAQRRRRRRRTLQHVVRLLATTAGGIFAAYLLFVFMGKVVHPYKLGYEVGREVDQARAQLDSQRTENEQLHQRLRYLNSDEGAEREARREGFYRPGETVYLLRE